MPDFNDQVISNLNGKLRLVLTINCSSPKNLSPKSVTNIIVKLSIGSFENNTNSYLDNIGSKIRKDIIILATPSM